jgi:hypothetical protein
VAVSDWLGRAPEELEPAQALARLARRYLAGHGPADWRDLAKWAGISLAEARRGLDGIADELTGNVDGLVDLVGRKPAAPLPGPRLLGPFDPLLHGWVSRQAIVGPYKEIVTTNGLFRPFALVDGRAVALWSLTDGRVIIRPLERIRRADLRALQQDSIDVLRYLHLPASAPVVEPYEKEPPLLTGSSNRLHR